MKYSTVAAFQPDRRITTVSKATACHSHLFLSDAGCVITQIGLTLRWSSICFLLLLIHIQPPLVAVQSRHGWPWTEVSTRCCWFAVPFGQHILFQEVAMSSDNLLVTIFQFIQGALVSASKKIKIPLCGSFIIFEICRPSFSSLASPPPASSPRKLLAFSWSKS